MRSGPTQVTAGSADGAAADSGALAMPSAAGGAPTSSRGWGAASANAAGCNCKSGSSSAIKPLDMAGAGASGSS